MPEGHDPDSFVHQFGLSRFLEMLNVAPSMFDFYLGQRITAKESYEKKVVALNEVLPFLSEIRNYSLRSLYVRRLSEKIGIRENVVLSELKAFMKRPSKEVSHERILGELRKEKTKK